MEAGETPKKGVVGEKDERSYLMLVEQHRSVREVRIGIWMEPGAKGRSGDHQESIISHYVCGQAMSCGCSLDSLCEISSSCRRELGLD